MLKADNNALQRATPESQGISSAAILKFVEAVENQVHELHSFMLLRHGKVIAEGWWSPCKPETPHLLFSLSKSFTSTAVGMAVAEGRFSIDDPVLSFFPDYAPAETNEHWAALRVRHLLTMSTGQAEDTWPYMVDRPDGDWIKGFFSIAVRDEPGTRFVYNNGATHLLSAIIQRTTGMKLVDYLEVRLFEPLGILNATWKETPQGISAGCIGLSLKTEDVARFGQLYLQKGRWQDQQLLTEEWVTEATGKRIENGGIDVDWSQGYGYQFWRGRHNVYRGDGMFGQWCIVMPDQDAVLAITSGVDLFDSQQPLELVWDLLLAAMQPDALPEDESNHAALTEKLSALAFPPAQGEKVSPVGSQVSGRVYKVDANVLKIETLTFNFAESECMVKVKTAMTEDLIACGYGVWLPTLPTRITLFNQPLLFDQTPAAASGAWTAEDTFTLIVRLYETPFYYTLACTFADDELMIEIQINTSLESMKPILLTASAVAQAI